MTNNPFHRASLAAESLQDETILEFWVNRDAELQQSLSALTHQRQNVLIRGEKGTGKTFLVRRLFIELSKTKDCLPVTVNLAQLPPYSPSDVASAFPKAVLLQVCVEVWKELLGHSFLDLTQATGTSQRKDIFSDDATRLVEKIYSNLACEWASAKEGWSNKVGAKALFTADKEESGERAYQRSSIMPFEFVEYAEIIQKEVLPRFGKTRLVALCDEANLLPFLDQQQILHRYLELFLSKRIQFAMVVGYWGKERSLQNIPTAFEKIVTMREFQSVDYINQLITKVTKDSEFVFTDDAVNSIFNAFKGHPRKTLIACADAVNAAIDQSCNTIGSNHLVPIIEEIQEEYRRWEEYWSEKDEP